MPVTVTRDEARKLVEALPETFSWDGLLQVIFERMAIERGLADIEAGRYTDVDELRRELGFDD